MRNTVKQPFLSLPQTKIKANSYCLFGDETEHQRKPPHMHFSSKAKRRDKNSLSQSKDQSYADREEWTASRNSVSQGNTERMWTELPSSSRHLLGSSSSQGSRKDTLIRHKYSLDGGHSSVLGLNVAFPFCHVFQIF